MSFNHASIFLVSHCLKILFPICVFLISIQLKKLAFICWEKLCEFESGLIWSFQGPQQHLISRPWGNHKLHLGLFMYYVLRIDYY